MSEENNNQYDVPQQDNQQYYQAPPQQPTQGYYNQFNGNIPPMPPQEEKANVGLAILSFFIPIVGIVLYFVQKNDKPKTAKACGKAALACIIIGVIVSIISTVASFLFASKVIEEEGLNDPSIYENYEDYEDFLNSYDFGDVTEPEA